VANTTDGAHEKHVPMIEQIEDTVTVKGGSVEHPSLEAHYIEFIVLVTEGGMQMKCLKHGMKPEAVFKVKDQPLAAYEYCNLHGLWMAEV
jgi:superoxide reductase